MYAKNDQKIKLMMEYLITQFKTTCKEGKKL